MATDTPRKALLPVVFSASSIVLLLAATACFLGSFVLPIRYPELAEMLRRNLQVLGSALLSLAVISILFRPWLTRLAQRIGIRSRVLLPREGVVYLGIMLVIAVGALTGGNPDTGNMLLLVFGMMAGPFVFNGWVVVVMLARVSVSRSLPLAAQAGSYFSVEVSLENGKKYLSSRLVEVRDVVEGNRLREEPAVTFVRVGPGDQRSGQYELCIRKRGVYQFGPLRISSRFPLGIGERGYSIPDRRELVIHPALGHLLPAWKRRERQLAESVNHANARMGIFDDEFRSIRGFRPGDSRRAIHWRSTARHGQLMVKEHQQHREADLIVLLDFFATPEFTEDLQEIAVSLVATLCVEQTRHASSGTYRLAIAGRELQTLEVAGAGRFRDAALVALSVCQVSPRAGLASMMLAVCQGPISAGSRFVLITPRPEAATLLSEAIARDAMKNEIQLTSRLMILKCDRATLSDVFAPAAEADISAGGDQNA
jgi:uncharacterized protein (DUF58 family)